MFGIKSKNLKRIEGDVDNLNASVNSLSRRLEVVMKYCDIRREYWADKEKLKKEGYEYLDSYDGVTYWVKSKEVKDIPPS